MPILYSVVAQGSSILAKYASCAGNFQEVTEKVLCMIGTENSKMTYSQKNYLFHYIVEEGICYLCITDDDFDRSKAFAFLNEVKKRFARTYRQKATNVASYALQSEFSPLLAAEMRHFSDSSSRHTDSMARVEEELDELKGIMIKNIDSVAKRGERLELLVEKADDLNSSSLTFKKSSRGLAKAMLMKNVKIMILMAIICIIVLYFIISAICGFDMKKC